MRPTWGHVRNRNHGIHLGQNHTGGKQLRQHKRPQTSDDPPRSSKIDTETGRTYLTPVWRLSVNVIRHVSGTRLRTPEYRETGVNLNATIISQCKN